MTSSRRHFLASVSAAGMDSTASRPRAAPSPALRPGLHVVRGPHARRPRRPRRGARHAGRAFREHCLAFGARGGQIDFSQLPRPTPPAAHPCAAREERIALESRLAARSWRRRGLRRGRDGSRAGRHAAPDGAARGRRYETFETAASAAFTTKWRETLRAGGPSSSSTGCSSASRTTRTGWRRNSRRCCVPSTARTSAPASTSATTWRCSRIPTRPSRCSRPSPSRRTSRTWRSRPRRRLRAVGGAAGDGDPAARPVRARGAQRTAGRPLCLEMITRDPLRVPYRSDRYWVAFDAAARDAARLSAFEHASPVARVDPAAAAHHAAWRQRRRSTTRGRARARLRRLRARRLKLGMTVSMTEGRPARAGPVSTEGPRRPGHRWRARSRPRDGRGAGRSRGRRVRDEPDARTRRRRGRLDREQRPGAASLA